MMNMMLKVVWVAIGLLLCIVILRAMAWADTGMKGGCPVEEYFLPAELRGLFQ